MVNITALNSATKYPSILCYHQHGQPFLDEMGLQAVKDKLYLTLVPGKWGVQLPATIEDTYKWLCEAMPQTECLLDSTGKGKAEGVVVRNGDRSFITKIRFEDYERHFKKVGQLK